MRKQRNGYCSLNVMRAIDQSFIAGIFQIVILAIMGGIGIMPNCKGQFVTSVESVFPMLHDDCDQRL